MGIIFGIAASVSFALFFIFIKKSYEQFPPSISFFFDMLWGLVLWIPFSLIVGFDPGQIWKVFPYAIVSALLSEAFSFYVLSKGEISLTGTIFSTYPVYTVIFSYFILGERLNSNQLIFVIITILGIGVATLPKKFTYEDLKQKSFILWALVGAIAVGFSDTLSKHIIDRSSSSTFLFCIAIAQIPISLIYLKLEKQSIKQFKDIFRNIHKYTYSLLGAFFSVFGLIFFWMAFQYTKASIASPLTGSYPWLVIVIALVWLRERPTKIELTGALIIMLGLLGISLV